MIIAPLLVCDALEGSDCTPLPVEPWEPFLSWGTFTDKRMSLWQGLWETRRTGYKIHFSQLPGHSCSLTAQPQVFWVCFYSCPIQFISCIFNFQINVPSLQDVQSWVSLAWNYYWTTCILASRAASQNPEMLRFAAKSQFTLNARGSGYLWDND